MKMPSQKSLGRWHEASIVWGSIIWLLLSILPFWGQNALSSIDRIFLLAPLLIVTFGLAFVGRRDQSERHQKLYAMTLYLQPFGAIAASISFLLPTCPLAAGFAAGWLLVTALMAILGVGRFLSRTVNRAEEVSIDVGLMLVAIGGGWLVLSRWGATPRGFSDLIVMLTAVHFHYAGFAALVMTGIVGRRLRATPEAPQTLYRGVVLGLIAGTPLIAAGITFSPLIELVGAIILATSLVLLAYLILFVILKTIDHGMARLLLVVSAGSLVVGMVFSSAYALGQFRGQSLLSIHRMVVVHGLTNSLGFALCGLGAWHLVYKPFRQREDESSIP